MVASYIYVEALIGGEKAIATEVPFADACAAISGGLEEFGDGDFLQLEQFSSAGSCDGAFGVGLAAWNPIGDAGAQWVAASQNAGASGRAHWAGSIGIGETGAFGGKAIDVGGEDIWIAVASEVAPAEVVGQD